MGMQREDGGQQMVIEDILIMQVQQVFVHNHHATQQKQKMLQIMFQNINGLLVSITHPKNDSLWDTIILGVAEVNMAWHTVHSHA